MIEVLKAREIDKSIKFSNAIAYRTLSLELKEIFSPVNYFLVLFYCVIHVHTYSVANRFGYS